MADSLSYEAPAHVAAALPVTIPSRLIGRDALLGRVYTFLKENRAVQVTGAPGSGKTALTATLAAAYTEQPGGVLWLDVDNSSIESLLVRIGRAYGVREITSTEYPLGMIGAVANTLTRHKPLIVLDGSLSDQVAQAFVARCAPNLPVLFTTSAELSASWPKVELGGLDVAHGAALFNLAAGLPDAAESGAKPLVEMLRGMPFALCLAGAAARAGKQSPDQLVTALSQIPGAANADPTLLALTAAFRGLNSALQGIILMLGATFNRQASAEMLSTISGVPQETITQAMNALATQYLVEKLERFGAPHYRLHEVTYAFAQTWLRGSQRLESLQQKVHDAVLAYAETHTASSSADHDRLAAELDTFLATAEWSAGRGDRDTASRLIVALTQAGDFVKERGCIYELLRLRRLAASSTSAFPAYPVPSAPSFASSAKAEPENEIAGDAGAAGALIRSLFADEDDGLAYDEEDEALGEGEGDAALETTPPSRPTKTAGEEGEEEEETAGKALPADMPAWLRADLDAEEREGETARASAPAPAAAPQQEEDEAEGEESVAFYRPAAAAASVESLFAAVAARETAPAPSAAETKPDASTAGGAEAESVEAIEAEEEADEAPVDELTALRTALLQARQRSDRARQGSLLMQIGALQIARGQRSEAIATYGEALTLYEDSGDDHKVLDVLNKLSALMVRTNNGQAAVLHAARGVQLAQRLNDQAAELQLYATLGDARQQLGESADAERAYGRALEIARRTDDTHNEAMILFKLGYAQLDNSDPNGAINSWEQALKLFRAQGKRAYEGRVLGGLGTAYGDLGQWSEAIRFHSSALHIAREVGDRDEEALQLSYLGYAAVQTGDLGQAVLRYRQALHLAYESGDRNNIVSTIVDLARLLTRGPRHLGIARLLVEDALRLEPSDRDVNDLKARIEADIAARQAAGIEQLPVTGTAQEYAANAYRLLES
ncbi:MAG: tetratricopeptide repeat protein [Aggregatilineales bacterium]